MVADGRENLRPAPTVVHALGLTASLATNPARGSSTHIVNHPLCAGRSWWSRPTRPCRPAGLTTSQVRSPPTAHQGRQPGPLPVCATVLSRPSSWAAAPAEVEGAAHADVPSWWGEHRSGEPWCPALSGTRWGGWIKKGLRRHGRAMWRGEACGRRSRAAGGTPMVTMPTDWTCQA